MNLPSTHHATPTTRTDDRRIKVYERPLRLQRWFLPTLLPAALLFAALLAFLVLVLA